MGTSRSIPTVEIKGPAGVLVINDLPVDIAHWRDRGYVFKDEAREKAHKGGGPKSGPVKETKGATTKESAPKE